MRNLVCFLLVSAMALSAAELTGKWSGSFEITNSNGETKADTAYMKFEGTWRRGHWYGRSQ